MPEETIIRRTCDQCDLVHEVREGYGVPFLAWLKVQHMGLMWTFCSLGCASEWCQERSNELCVGDNESRKQQDETTNP